MRVVLDTNRAYSTRSRCASTSLDLHKRLSYAWRSGTGAAGLDTVVTWTLTPTASGGTRLALEQSGFLPANKFAFDGASTGWQRMVGERLREVLPRTA